MAEAPSAYSNLSTQQRGRIAEMLAAERFIAWDFEVYAPLVDEKGIDLIVRPPGQPEFLEIQVKSATGNNYVFIPKRTVDPKMLQSRFICYVRFVKGAAQEIYLIPLSAWDSIDSVLTERSYDKLGQTSKPEYGINFSQKNSHMLDEFAIERMLEKLSSIPSQEN